MSVHGEFDRCLGELIAALGPEQAELAASLAPLREPSERSLSDRAEDVLDHVRDALSDGAAEERRAHLASLSRSVLGRPAR